MEPLIIDAYTSAAGSDQPKKVFYIGDSISWNVVHAAAFPELIGQPYRLTTMLRKVRLNAWYDSDDPYEFIYRVQRYGYADWPDLWEGTFEWWQVEEIPDVSQEQVLRFPNIRTALTELGRDRFVDVFEPGYWTMTAFLEMTSSVAHAEFSVKADWYYRIAGYRPPI